MKCLRNLTLSAALLIASCSQYEDKEQYDKHFISPVLAEIGEETRTSIGEKGDNGYKVVWETGDKIIVSTGISSKDQMIYVTEDAGKASAAFYPVGRVKALDFSGGAIAGYPVENMYLGNPDADKEVYFTIPSVQYYKEDSFDSGSMPMISEVTSEPSLHFHNAAGVIKLLVSTELSDIKVSSISIATSGMISGECGYIPSSRKIFFDDSMLSSNEVTLECEEEVEIDANPTAFHIVVPHQTYEDMSIKVMTTEGLQQTFTMKSGKEIEIGRSSISSIPLKVTSITPASVPKISAKITSTTFSDIRLEIKMENVTSYHCGIETKSSFTNEMESGSLLESIPYRTPYTTPLTYSGSISSFQSEFSDILIEPGQSYVIWFIPHKNDGNYTADDIFYVETMTKFYSPGGKTEVYYTDLAIDKTSISMTLNAPGAGHIYAQLFTQEQMRGFRSENEIIKTLLEPGNKSSVIDRESDIFIRKFLKPDTGMILAALAIERTGRYGPLFIEEFRTEAIPYTSKKVSINKDIDKVRESSIISWTIAEGEVSEYRYIFRETDSYLWQNTLQESVLSAQETMYLNPGLYYINHTTTPEATMSNLVSGQEYIIIVVAAEEDGNISVADSWTFTY